MEEGRGKQEAVYKGFAQDKKREAGRGKQEAGREKKEERSRKREKEREKQEEGRYLAFPFPLRF